MKILRKGVDVGKVIADRVKGYPVGTKEPEKKPPCWIVCPSFKLKAPKTVTKEGAERDHSYTIQIFSETEKQRKEALDHMIRCGQKEIADGSKRFWLHAVTYGFQDEALFTAELRYIFRVK